MASITEENYLKALFTLANDDGEVNLSDLSELLKVSKPTANSMVKNLQRQGMVNYEKYKPLSLTDMGKKTAALVIRKHRLTEMYLVEKMGFGWEEVHEIAEQIEHIKSPNFFDRMDQLMGNPSLDPHGSPIPDKQGRIVKPSHEPLINFEAGAEVRLSALANSEAEFLEFLNNRKLKLGTRLKVVSTEPFDGSMVVDYNDHSGITLGAKACERLLVQKISPPGSN